MVISVSGKTRFSGNCGTLLSGLLIWAVCCCVHSSDAMSLAQAQLSHGSLGQNEDKLLPSTSMEVIKTSVKSSIAVSSLGGQKDIAASVVAKKEKEIATSALVTSKSSTTSTTPVPSTTTTTTTTPATSKSSTTTTAPAIAHHEKHTDTTTKTQETTNKSSKKEEAHTNNCGNINCSALERCSLVTLNENKSDRCLPKEIDACSPATSGIGKSCKKNSVCAVIQQEYAAPFYGCVSDDSSFPDSDTKEVKPSPMSKHDDDLEEEHSDTNSDSSNSQIVKCGSLTCSDKAKCSIVFVDGQKEYRCLPPDLEACGANKPKNDPNTCSKQSYTCSVVEQENKISFQRCIQKIGGPSKRTLCSKLKCANGHVCSIIVLKEKKKTDNIICRRKIAQCLPSDIQKCDQYASPGEQGSCPRDHSCLVVNQSDRRHRCVYTGNEEEEEEEEKEPSCKKSCEQAKQKCYLMHHRDGAKSEQCASDNETPCHGNVLCGKGMKCARKPAREGIEGGKKECIPNDLEETPPPPAHEPCPCEQETESKPSLCYRFTYPFTQSAACTSDPCKRKWYCLDEHRAKGKSNIRMCYKKRVPFVIKPVEKVPGTCKKVKVENVYIVVPYDGEPLMTD